MRGHTAILRTAIAGTALIASCARSTTNHGSPGDKVAAVDRESEAKMQLSPMPGTSLRLVSRIGLGGASLKNPVALAVTKEKSRHPSAFIWDNNTGGLVRIGLDSQQVESIHLNFDGAEPVRWPLATRWTQGQLHVLDPAGIRSFVAAKHVRTVNPFLSFSDFAVDSRRRIIIPPALRAAVQRRPVLLELDPDGRKRVEFGEISVGNQLAELRATGFVCVTETTVGLAFKHDATVALFDRATRERRDIAVKHPAFDRLRQLDRDTTFNRPRRNEFRLSKYIAGVIISDTWVRVLLDLPYVQILQYRRSGELTHVYTWQSPLPIRRYFGVDHSSKLSDVVIGFATSATAFEIVRLTGFAE